MNLIDKLDQLGLFIATAESLTGGLIAAKLIDTPGASRAVLGGIVAYQNDVKQTLLEVPRELLASVGAVDSQVAMAMATSIRERFAVAGLKDPALVIGLSATGVAGPNPVDGHQVGEVLIGFSSAIGQGFRAYKFEGDRAQIRAQSVNAALEWLREHLDEF